MTGLFRRGGVWWSRLVVPARLRAKAGRREFVQSCRTHELAIAKLVAAALLADWRLQLLRLESRTMSVDVLKLVEGAPGLAGIGFLPLCVAADLSGIAQIDLLRSAADGGLGLFCRFGRVSGHLVPQSELLPASAEAGRFGGLAVPTLDQMPPDAVDTTMSGVLRLADSDDIAGSILADELDAVTLVLLEAPDRPGWFFIPATAVCREVGTLEVRTFEVDALRQQLAQSLSADRVELAKAARKAATGGVAAPAGKWAHTLFSAAVEEYCSRNDGLRDTLASEHEVRQRKNGLMTFAEFMGDKPLSAVDDDLLRAFRDGPLKDFPAHANRLKKGDKGATMRETVVVLKSRPDGYERMTAAQRTERMRWLFRMFEWLVEKRHITNDPAIALRGEDGMSRAERIEASRDDDDEEGRRPFTDDELKLIFEAQHYQTGNGMHITKGNETWYPFQYWLPLLGLFAGCRIKEASQLHLSDLVRADGVWCLDINRRTADKSLKTEASIRRVPLNKMLIDLGFVDYCERLRQEGFLRVFPELTYTLTPARYAKEPIRKMSAMLKSLGMPRDGTLVYHCLRHNLNNALARASADALRTGDEKLRVFIRYRVIGHELPEDVNAKHYTSTTAAELSALVNAVQYDLPKITRFDIDHGVARVRGALEKKMGDRRGREDMGPLNPD